MKILFSFLLLLIMPLTARADIKPVHLYSFETAAGMKAGAVFGEIGNTGTEDDLLLGVKTPVCKDAQIHEMSDDNNIMKMRQVKSLALPAKDKTELKPMGYHIMLIGLKAPLQNGKTFPLTLIFDKAGKIDTTVTVKSRQVGTMTDDADGMDMGMHSHHD